MSENDNFKNQLLKAIIKADDLESELIGLKNKVSDRILDMKIQRCRDSCTNLRKSFEKFFAEGLNYEIGDYLDRASKAIDKTVDEFIKAN
jgi:hypothetical protein